MIIKLPFVLDVSHWRDVPNFAAVSPRPFLVITKATEGNWYQDPTFVPYFRDLQQDGIHRGAYHFNRKSIGGLFQAQYFCNFIRPHITSNDILALDVEEGGESAAQLQAWFTEVIRQFPANHDNGLVMIYSRKNILEGIPTFLQPFARFFVTHPLNAIPMTTEQRAFFRQIPIWTAGYPSNPDSYSSVPSFYIPDQTKWGAVEIWQYTDRGVVAGIADPVDCNWIAPALVARLGGVVTPPPVNTDTTTFPHDGMKLIAGVRNGWKFRLIITDPAKVRYELVSTPGLETVPSVVARKNATFGCNAGEWDRVSAPKDYTVSNGNIIKARVEAVPSFMVLDGNQLWIDHVYTPDANQAFSGLRYLIRGGIIQSYLSGTEPQYTEGHARMIAGVSSVGHAMILLSEGIYPNQGLKLKEAAEIMKQYGCVTCADFGGGGDAGGVLDGEDLIKPENIYNGVNFYRRLPMTFLIYANETGGTMNGTAKESRGTNSTVRGTPSRYGASKYTIQAGSTIEFTAVVPVIVGGVADNANDKWLKLPDGNFVNYILAGTTYYTILTHPTTEPPPPPDTEGLKVNYAVQETFPQEGRMRWSVRRNNGTTEFTDYPI